MKKSIIAITLCMAAFTLTAQTIELPELAFRSTSAYEHMQVNPNMQYSTFTPANALLLGGDTQEPEMINVGSGSRRNMPGTPPAPIGDAALPLTLMALAFCGVLYLRRRKA